MTVRGKKNLLITFLALLTIWPPIHFGLAKAFDIEIWHLAGWAMYIRPHLKVEVEATQLDGTPFPNFEEFYYREENLNTVRNMHVLGTLVTAEPIAQRVLAAQEPGEVDGIELRVIVERYDPRSHMFVRDLREIIRLEADTPRSALASARQRYGSGVELEDLAGTRWNRPEGYADSLRTLVFNHQAVLFGFDDGTWDEYPVQAESHDACGDYPLCFGLVGASGNASPFPVYLENGVLYLAECLSGEDARRFMEIDDEEVLSDYARVVVWRDATTVCTSFALDDGYDPEVPFNPERGQEAPDAFSRP